MNIPQHLLRHSASSGVDIGASLAKIVIRKLNGDMSFEIVKHYDIETILYKIEHSGVNFCGVTGGGAPKLQARLGDKGLPINEFAAWGAGASLLGAGNSNEVQCPFLLVSIGTGTSVMAVTGMSVVRVGGTALGGGTIMGLGRALVGEVEYEEICHLAEQGNRNKVDLFVDDIYEPGVINLGGALTAANFGRLALANHDQPSRADLAAAMMELIGENIVLITLGLAQKNHIERVVYAGSCLRNNPALHEILVRSSQMLGLQAELLENGEFAGALGALALADAQSASQVVSNLA